VGSQRLTAGAMARPDKTVKVGPTHFQQAFFAILHNLHWPWVFIYCRHKSIVAKLIVLIHIAETEIIYCIILNIYTIIFQINVVELSEFHILFHEPIFFTAIPFYKIKEV
jgi:hypothetical protein